jgi:hypothetical protein
VIDLFSFLNGMIIFMVVYFYCFSKWEGNHTKSENYYNIAKYSLMGWVIVVGIATTAWFLTDSVIGLFTTLYHLIK